MASVLAALMIGADPDLTPARVRDILKGTGQPITDTRGGCSTCPVFKRVKAYDAVYAVDRRDGACQEAGCANPC